MYQQTATITREEMLEAPDIMELFKSKGVPLEDPDYIIELEARDGVFKYTWTAIKDLEQSQETI